MDAEADKEGRTGNLCAAFSLLCITPAAFSRSRGVPACPADEIDAIGKARSTGPADSGTQEREQGLLQLLTEMDGFYQNDQVGGSDQVVGR